MHVTNNKTIIECATYIQNSVVQIAHLKPMYNHKFLFIIILQ